MTIQEKRRYGRLLAPLDVAYAAALPVKRWTLKGQGICRDISLGGLYFHTELLPAVKPGVIMDLVISLSPSHPAFPGLSRLTARGKVERLDPPAPGARLGGVALSFLTALSFLPPDSENFCTV